MLLKEFLPERSAEDIWAERIRLRLGGQEFILSVLPMAANDVWKAKVSERAAGLFAGLDGLKTMGDVIAIFGTVETSTMVELLRAYDRDGVLPDDGWLRENVSEQSVLRAFLEVFATANPTMAAVLDLMIRNPELIKAILSEGLTASGNGSQPSTAGTPETSESV